MSLMESVRSSTDNVFIQVLFGAIVLSFVFWGVGANGPTSATVAEVNGQRITNTEFSRVMRRVARGQRSQMSDDELEVLKGQVLSSLIEQRVMLQAAEDLGIEISDQEIASYLLQIDAFKDEDGKFSKSLQDRTLQAQGITVDQFYQDLREDLMRARLAELTSMSVQVTPEQVKDFYVSENSNLALRWLRISEGTFRDDVEISDEDLAAAIADRAEELQAAYDRQKDRRFTEPRKAKLRTILLRTDLGDLAEDTVRERMDKVREEIIAGGDFAEAARRWSEDASAVQGGDMGELEEPRMDPELAEAVFATEVGSVTAVIQNAAGFQLVKVEGITDAVVTPLADVQEDLARELLEKERAPALADAFAQEVLSAWKSSSEPPQELLDEQGLQLGEADRLRPDATSIPRLGPAEDILAAAVTASSGDVLDTLFEAGGAKVIVQVVERNEADLDAFANEQTSWRQRLLLQERYAFIESWQNDLVASAEIVRYF
jgi:peptidyl-prolyl cis-trans isomerase D